VYWVAVVAVVDGLTRVWALAPAGHLKGVNDELGPQGSAIEWPTTWRFQASITTAPYTFPGCGRSTSAW